MALKREGDRSGKHDKDRGSNVCKTETRSEDGETKLLGLTWDKNRDSIQITVRNEAAENAVRNEAAENAVRNEAAEKAVRNEAAENAVRNEAAENAVRNEAAENTKRGILGKLAKMCDPLGLVSPLTLTGKTLYRKACDLKIAWDAPLPSTLLQKWLKYERTFRVKSPHREV